MDLRAPLPSSTRAPWGHVGSPQWQKSGNATPRKDLIAGLFFFFYYRNKRTADKANPMKRPGPRPPLEEALFLPEARRRRLGAPIGEEDVASQPGAPLGLGALPPEMIEMVLAAAGPFGTARAARASSTLRDVGRDLAQQQSLASRARYCPDYWSCVLSLTDAIAMYDANLVETILASGVISMTLPLISPDATLPVTVPSDRGPHAITLLTTPAPIRGGWTPLALSGFVGAASVVQRLASLGARPLPTAASLISGLLLRKRQVVPHRATLQGVNALIQAYPATRPLAAIDINPLTALRLYAVSRAQTVSELVLKYVYGAEASPVTNDSAEALAQAIAQRYPKGAEARPPAEREAAAVAARDLGTWYGNILFAHWVKPLLYALLRAGYDPRERTLVAPIKTIDVAAGVSEAGAAAAYERARAMISGDPARCRKKTWSAFISCWVSVLENHMEIALVAAILVAYNAATVPHP
nr:hypothetical protein [Pandoravirus massiliensis]